MGLKSPFRGPPTTPFHMTRHVLRNPQKEICGRALVLRERSDILYVKFYITYIIYYILYIIYYILYNIYILYYICYIYIYTLYME